jgi:hypothetical protein
MPDYRPSDPQIAFHLARFIENFRGIPADPVVLRQSWLRAYDFTTAKGALALNDYARNNDPFAQVGKVQVAVDVSSVIRASDDSFRIAWTERRYQDGSLAATERWSAIATVAIQTPRTPDALRKNPLGVFVNALNWSKELDAMTRSARRRPAGMLALAALPLWDAQCFPRPDPTADFRRRAGRRSRPEQRQSCRDRTRPEPLPLPGQLKPVATASCAPEAADPRTRIGSANAAARMQPVREGFLNAIQQYPWAEGALYQLYAAPGQVTDIALQEGEQLVGPGAGRRRRHRALDHRRHAERNRRRTARSYPGQADPAGLVTNLVINTDRRTYHLELRSTPETYMASVSWTYPQDALIALAPATVR